jgi:hypothetical protein
VWGRLSEDRAKRIFPILHDWVRGGAGAGAGVVGPTNAAPEGRCFFKSTTAGATSFRDHYFETELRTIRPHAVQSGCTYLDFAYLTEDFGALDYESSLRTPRAERRSVFVDQVSALDWALDREVCALLLVRAHDCLRPSFFSLDWRRSTFSRGCTRSSTRFSSTFSAITGRCSLWTY